MKKTWEKMYPFLLLYSILYILTKKNFGLIHIYFLYTAFRVTYRTLFSKGYMTTKLKIFLHTKGRGVAQPSVHNKNINKP